MRSLLAALVGLLALVSTLRAQRGEPFWDRVTPQTGFLLSWTPIQLPGGGSAVTSTPVNYNLHFGAGYLIGHRDDIYSLSAELGVALAPFAVLSGGPSEFFFQPSGFLIARAWGGATRYNQQRVGLGLGLGATYTYLQLPLLVGNADYTLQQWFPAPAALVEATFNGRSGTYTLRGTWNLVPYQAPFDQALDTELEYQNFSVGLIVRMGR